MRLPDDVHLPSGSMGRRVAFVASHRATHQLSDDHDDHCAYIRSSLEESLARLINRKVLLFSSKETSALLLRELKSRPLLALILFLATATTSCSQQTVQINDIEHHTCSIDHTFNSHSPITEF